MAQMVTQLPTQKLVSSTVASAFTTILIWGLNTYAPLSEPIPEVVVGAILTVVTALVGYYTPPAPRDQIRNGV